MATKGTCLITGAGGLLGREVVPALDAAGWKTLPLALRARAGLRSVDLRDPDAWRAVLREMRPDAVVHLAAYREPDVCEEQVAETRRLNVDPVRIARETLPAGVPQLFVSTDYVFDGLTPPYREDSARNAVSEYGRSKCLAEDALAGSPDAIVLRVPLLIGGGPVFRESGFIAQMVEAVLAGKPQTLDDVLVRYPCWTRDVAGAIAFLLGGGHRGTFHLSGPRGGTRFAWTVETARLLGKSADPFTPSKVVVPRKAVRPPDSHLDDAKLRALGFKTATDLTDAIRAVLAELPDSPVRV